MSNLRNTYVALSNLRNVHVPCHYIFRSHIACRYGLKYPMSPCRFYGSRAIHQQKCTPPPPPSQRRVCIGRMQCAYNTQGVNATSQHYGRKTTVTDFQFNTAVYRFKLSLCGVDLLIRRQFSGHCRESFLRCFPHDRTMASM